MMNNQGGARGVKLIDIPLVTRLLDTGVMLDSDLAYTGNADLSSAALLSNFLLPQRSTYSVLANAGKQHVVGQFRLRHNPEQAQHRLCRAGPAL